MRQIQKTFVLHRKPCHSIYFSTPDKTSKALIKMNFLTYQQFLETATTTTIFLKRHKKEGIRGTFQRSENKRQFAAMRHACADKMQPPERYFSASFAKPVSHSTPSSYDIKSASLGLLALVLKSSDVSMIGQQLRQQFKETPDFFENDPVLLDMGLLQAQEGVKNIDFAALVALLKHHKLDVMAVKGALPEQEAAARAAGLRISNDARIQKRVEQAHAVQQSQQHVQAPIVPPPGPKHEKALVIDRPLRSGQQVYARGADALVLAMVNPGAEVIADGHIHVYAPLRGRAIAGARGNTEARIFAQSMEAELVSIAGVYRSNDGQLPKNIQGKAVQVSLLKEGSSEKLVFSPISA
jgi:septum site-determining protein MinC